MLKEKTKIFLKLKENLKKLSKRLKRVRLIDQTQQQHINHARIFNSPNLSVSIFPKT